MTKTWLAVACLILCALSVWSQPSVTLGWTAGWSALPVPVTNYRIYCWTNNIDTNCLPTNAVQTMLVGPVTNATVQGLVPAAYTFGATSVITNFYDGTNGPFSSESAMSQLAHWIVLPPPVDFYLQQSTNLTAWTTVTNQAGSPIFFRLLNQ